MSQQTASAPPASPDGAGEGVTQDPLRGRHTPIGRAIVAIGVVLSLAHLYFNTLGTFPELWTSSISFAGFGLLCCLRYPAFSSTTPTGRRLALGLDVGLGLLLVACVAHLIFAEEAFYARGSSFIAPDWFFASACVVIAIELTRRTTGWLIPALIVLSLVYVVGGGRFIEGVFQFPGLSAETVLFRQYFSTDGMFGPIARISSTFVFMFILFGAFLVRSGAGDFIIQLAMCAAGRLAGGPGLVAVLGSALMGSISGSAVANVVSTGVVTIPLMKRAGFPPRFAAGVEAAASTGGQLMPPVMGAGAFIMATYTGISYLAIIAAATLPALMYFASVAIWVRIEALKHNVVAQDLPEAPKLVTVLKEGGHNAVPIVALVAFLIAGYTPTYAAGMSILAAVVASWLSPRRDHRMGPRAILEALALGARNMATVAVLLTAVGIIVNVIGTTGIGNTFSLMITGWAGGSLLLTLVLVALASLVLGMGLPVTAAYIVLATLSAPAIKDLIVQAQLIDLIASGQLPEQARAIFMLVAPESVAALAEGMSRSEAAALLARVPVEFVATLNDQALDPAVVTAALLSAHMIIYWLSQDSNITPPVCLTAFAAAAVAGTKPMATGVTAWRIAKGLYIVPLLMAYTPLLSGQWFEVLPVVVFGILGIYALNGAIAGFLEAPVPLLGRFVLVVAAAGLLWPQMLPVNLMGGALLALIVVVNLRSRATMGTVATSGAPP